MVLIEFQGITVDSIFKGFEGSNLLKSTRFSISYCTLIRKEETNLIIT